MFRNIYKTEQKHSEQQEGVFIRQWNCVIWGFNYCRGVH